MAPYEDIDVIFAAEDFVLDWLDQDVDFSTVVDFLYEGSSWASEIHSDDVGDFYEDVYDKAHDLLREIRENLVQYGFYF